MHMYTAYTVLQGVFL